MNAREMQHILDLVTYKEWRFEIHTAADGTRPYLQLHWVSQDVSTDNQNSRKWKLSAFMTRSELVQTAFKAVMTAEEHETRERFHYRGKPVFGPHIDVEQLWNVCDHLDVRDSLYEE
jgi:hypothetical protein